MTTGAAQRATSIAIGVAVAGIASKLFATAAVPAVEGAQWLWLFADDVALAAGLGLALRGMPAVVARSVGAVAIAWLALGVVFVHALGTPLLATMLCGLHPAMQDSAGPYLSVAALGPMLVVLGLGGLAAGCSRGWSAPRGPALLVLAVAILGCVLAPAPGHRAHRNACFAFARSLLPRALPVVEVLEITAPNTTEPAPLAACAGCARGRSVVVVVLESAAARFVDGRHPGGQPMPFLAELAAGGLACRNAYAVYPESIEGQVPLFCGLPPIPDGEVTVYAAHAKHALPRRLAAHGYASGLFHAGRFRFLGMEEVLAPFGFDVRADAGTIGGDAESSFGIDEESTVDALLRWVGGLERDQRFVACYLPIAGHHPYSSPPGGPFPRDTQLGCYANALHYADRSLRRLWEGLQRLRPAEDLLLCVVGDHGQAFGEHPGNFGHSFELYEENLRVPLCFHAPGSALAGLSTQAICSHLDVVPTLLDLLGLPDTAPAALRGSSLLRRPTTGGSTCAFTDWGELLVAARQGRWKLIHEVASGRDRLFDLDADPGELTNLATGFPEQAGRLRAAALVFAQTARRGVSR